MFISPLKKLSAGKRALLLKSWYKISMTTFYWAIKYFFLFTKNFNLTFSSNWKSYSKHWEHFMLNNEKKKIKCFLPSLNYGSLNTNKNARLSNASAVLCVSESRYESGERERETEKRNFFFVLPFYRRFCNSLFFSLYKIMLYAHAMIIFIAFFYVVIHSLVNDMKKS